MGKLSNPITAVFDETDYAAIRTWANQAGLSGSKAVRTLALHALKNPPVVEAKTKGLARQERAIFDMCAAGKVNTEIAEELNISLNQVSVVISKMHARGYDVPNREKRQARPPAVRAQAGPKTERVAAPPPPPKHEPWKPGDPKPDWLRRAG